MTAPPCLFQSTRPVRGATSTHIAALQQEIISIHAPRAGRDRKFSTCYTVTCRFQSTRPVRGATREYHL